MSNSYTPRNKLFELQPSLNNSLLINNSQQNPIQNSFVRSPPRQSPRKSSIQKQQHQRLSHLITAQQQQPVIHHQYPMLLSLEEASDKKYQVETLILEVNRLHRIIQELTYEKNVLQQILTESYEHKIKDLTLESECRIDKTQKQLLMEINKNKAIKKDHEEEKQIINKNHKRELSLLFHQNQRLSTHVKKIIEDKNEELYQKEQQHKKQIEKIKNDFQLNLFECKKQHHTQMKNQQAIITKQEHEISVLKEQKDENMDEIARISREHEQTIQKLKENHMRYIEGSKERHQKIKTLLKESSNNESQEFQRKILINNEIYNKQINILKEIIKSKDTQHQSLLTHFEIERQLKANEIEAKDLFIQALQQQNQQFLRQKLQIQEISKVKYAALHQKNMEESKNNYQSQINVLCKKIQAFEERIKSLQSKKQQLFEKNTNLQIEIEKMHSEHLEEIAKLKIKSYLENQQIKQNNLSENSILVSKNQFQIKNLFNKMQAKEFNQEQLLKLRKLLDEKEIEMEKLERSFQEDILNHKKQIQNLKNLKKNDDEYFLKQIKELELKLEQNQKFIQKINNQYNSYVKDTQKQHIEATKILEKALLTRIQELKQLNHGKDNEIVLLKDRCKYFQHTNKQLSSELEKYHLEFSIAIEEIKQEFQKLYAQKILDLQSSNQYQKNIFEQKIINFKEIIQSEQQKNSYLIGEVKDKQAQIMKLHQNIKKQKILETKIISLGMDNNLVKNIKELFQK